jgi:hypothetical protein
MQAFNREAALAVESLEVARSHLDQARRAAYVFRKLDLQSFAVTKLKSLVILIVYSRPTKEY